jgi:hypothetical protein
MDGVAIAHSLLNHVYGQHTVVVLSMITTRHRFKEIELINQDLPPQRTRNLKST